ncbi:MAG: ParB N-terminal domain-containing protein [archaeon]|nr:ParB N-terminal domain-containing protein [archaeon]
MIKAKIQKVSISSVKENDANPRFINKHKFKKLVASVKEFPEMLSLRPIVVDKDNIILGGNMRYKACKEIGLKEVYIIQADDLTDKQAQEFIIKDNVGFGEWDWDVLANEWKSTDLEEWGLDAWQNMDDIETSDDFSLPDGDKEPFQQQTYTLADAQAEQIKNAIADVKKTEEYKYIETFGNENSNGNALYLIISQWAEQKK